MTRLWLIGMMGTGKTAAGELAANRLGVGFADTDHLVEASAGRPISEIWVSGGEASFRALEKEAVASLSGFDGIIATGGGAAIDEDNRGVMGGAVVWLEARVSTIARRVGGDRRRPLLDSPELEEQIAGILEQRAPFYEMSATHRVETDGKGVDEVALEIAGIWNG